jgi:hypothetical protein
VRIVESFGSIEKKVGLVKKRESGKLEADSKIVNRWPI